MLNGNCVNTDGDCLYSSPCGKNDDGSGIGIGRIYFPGNDAHCNYDFGSDSADCYFDFFGSGARRGPVDLYEDGSFEHTPTKVDMLCAVSRVASTVIGGIAYGHYWDGKTYGFTPKLWKAVDGFQFWGYPQNFPLPANPFQTLTPPPPQPGSASLDVNYYGNGLPFFNKKAGFCNHAGPQA